jgi:hypothetical protein
MGESVLLDRTVGNIRRALETGGVEFTNGESRSVHPSKQAKFLAELAAVAEITKVSTDLARKIDHLISLHIERILEDERRLCLKELALSFKAQRENGGAISTALERVQELVRKASRKNLSRKPRENPIVERKRRRAAGGLQDSAATVA